MSAIVQSPDPDIDTLKCPKCGALWRAKGHYNYDEGGWVYEDEVDLCPNNCTTYFGSRMRGKLVPRD